MTGRGSTDAWTLLGALAGRTERLRLGTLVSPVTFRSPSVLARSAATVDQISGGRVEIGMSAGWWTEEHTQFGFGFPPTVDRFAMLEEQLEVVDGLLTEQPFSFHGAHYELDGAELLPSTVQQPRPPIILGGRRVGPWMQRLVGRWADEFNTVGGTTAEVRERFERARAGVEAVGREQGSLVTSLMTWCFVGETKTTTWRGCDARTRWIPRPDRSMRTVPTSRRIASWAHRSAPPSGCRNTRPLGCSGSC